MIDENLVLVHKQRERFKLGKLIYAGMSVLDISKTFYESVPLHIN